MYTYINIRAYTYICIKNPIPDLPERLLYIEFNLALSGRPSVHSCHPYFYMNSSALKEWSKVPSFEIATMIVSTFFNRESFDFYGSFARLSILRLYSTRYQFFSLINVIIRFDFSIHNFVERITLFRPRIIAIDHCFLFLKLE